MSTNNDSGRVITLEEACQYTHAYQSANPNAIFSYYVSTENLNLILQQSGCVGLRIYNGYNLQSKQSNIVLVGVDEKGNDMTNGVLLDEFVSCPPSCPTSSPLMKD
ncbi:hypothetical protein [Flavobacterium aurantiibacter]|uniref:Uncharacterized protein n=1 Tax=Flavobacterium aurantiibacter TaxID=2023067 RepID=A0A255ZN97_9FLAO|nr:hypothetical protein [Flavobacterium aurantiibacter]OYQ41989.1 hypothetical protein CHX27_12550 [Flavobacterium aurantiibacter]OYQ42891.1 hypothetical protein CHX27_11375 [Flavobacterium aurantiibacter]